MGKFNDREKINILKTLFEASNPVKVSDILDQLETPRRVRRALFVARQDGMHLEAIRDTGKTVTEYLWTNAEPVLKIPSEMDASSEVFTAREDMKELADRLNKPVPSEEPVANEWIAKSAKV